MTPEIFAFIIVPALPVLVGVIGYVVIVATDPGKLRSTKSQDEHASAAVGDLFDHRHA